MRNLLVVVVVLFSLATACAENVPHNQFITLGTSAGPNAEATRSQPANALLVNEDLYLVDAGDGAVGQLAKAGLRLQELDGVFISHSHFDHTGGLLAVLGLRSQLGVPGTLLVFGPPGTKTLVDGLRAGMAPAMEAAFGMPGRSWHLAVEVKEVSHGSTIELAGMTVQVAENTHFAIPETSGMAEKAKSLSFRFDLENRSIVYTGDTGPSKAIEKLAKGADLLVSEMMDIDAVLGNIRRQNPEMPQRQFEGIEWHLRAHHVLPIQVGELASNAGVEKVVVTHVAPNVAAGGEAVERYQGEISDAFNGEIVIANDLDRF